MTIPFIFPTITVDDLKRLKNSVIGNPSAKQAVVEDNDAMKTLVDLLKSSTSERDASIRTEAAHVVASLAHGSDRSLGSLLRHGAHRELLFALSSLATQDSLSLRSALVRALKTLGGALADIVGPPLYGIPQVERSSILPEAKDALSSLLAVDALDIYLPMLNASSSLPGHNTAVSTTLCQLISLSVRSAEHRKAVVEWLPPSKRKEREIDDSAPMSPTASTSTAPPRKNRGWEKPEVTIGRGGGGSSGGATLESNSEGTVRTLVELLSARDGKLQEAALEALAALSKDNPAVALALTRQSHPDTPPPISLVHSLTKSRNVDVQLAACICAARIIRACGMTGTYYLLPIDDACVRSILSIVNRILGSESEPVGNVIKSCFVLYFLITDDRKLSQLAYDRGCLDKLAKILKDITPCEAKEGWDEIEAENVSKLREAVLTALATLSLFNADVRRSVSDTHYLLPLVNISLTCKYTGVRYAACQVVRMLARTVAVLRTNLVDSGLGLAVFDIFKRDCAAKKSEGAEAEVSTYQGSGKEDRRVVEAALKAICNIVLEFSPLRPIFLAQGVMPRLMQLIHTEDGTMDDECDRSMRLNAMWAVKNLLWKSTTETKKDVMNQFGWKVLFQFLHDPSEEIQEQAYHIIRNIAETEPGISLVFRELCPLSSPLPEHTTVSATSSSLLDSIADVLHNSASPQAVVVQATYVLANLANGLARDTITILHHPRLLQALRTVIADRGSEVRRPAVSCILQLVMERDSARERRRVLISQGVGDTLRRVCEWAPTPSGAGGSAVVGSGGGRRLSHGSTGMGAPLIGGYLHPSDRGGGPGTSPTHVRSGSVGGHQNAMMSANGAFSPGVALTSPPSPGAHVPHMPYHGHIRTGHPHYHPIVRATHAGAMSASVPAGSNLGPIGAMIAYGGTSPPTNYPTGPGPSMGFAVPYGLPAVNMVASPGYVPLGVGVHAGSVTGAQSGVGLGPGPVGGTGLGSIGPHQSPHPAIDVDKEVLDRARRALDWLDHGDYAGM